MHSSKSKRFALHQLMLTVFLLLAGIVLLVTATFARYQENQISYFNFSAKTPGSISLQASDGWTFYSDGSGTLDLYISNTDDDNEYASVDQSVSVRLLASVAIAELSDVDVSLTVLNGTTKTIWTATPVEIQEGTSAYKTFGAGLAYIFRDENGNELSWNLAGGTLSILSAQLDVTGLSKPANPALLQLQVLGS